MIRLDIELLMDKFQGEVCAQTSYAMIVGHVIGLAKSRRTGQLFGTIETQGGMFYQIEVENIKPCQNSVGPPKLGLRQY